MSQAPCCCCLNRSWRAYGEASTLYAGSGDDPAGMAAAVEGYDFTGAPEGTTVLRANGTWFTPIWGSAVLKLQNQEFPSYKKVGGSVVVNATHYRFSAGWFKPSSYHYWKTVIARVGEHLSPSGTNNYGIFAAPVRSRVECTPNQIIQFGLPPVGETWLISDCEDDYNYTKITRDQELCLRVCIGDTDPWWSRMCHTFQVGSAEMAAYIAEYGSECGWPYKQRIHGCMDGRGKHNSVWQC